MNTKFKAPTHNEAAVIMLNDTAKSLEAGEEPKFILLVLDENGKEKCNCGRPECLKGKATETIINGLSAAQVALMVDKLMDQVINTQRREGQ